MNRRAKAFGLIVLACVLAVVSGLLALRFSAPAGRTIRFPDDRSMGWLKVRDRDSTQFDEWVEFGEAQGEIAVPEGKQLWLFVSPQGGDDISPLASLEPDDLQVLYLPHQIRGGDLVHIEHLTGLWELLIRGTVGDGDPPTLTDAHLVHMGGLSSLEVLTFDNRHAIYGSGLAYLSELDSLKELRLELIETGDRAVDLTHLSVLSSLNSLYLLGGGFTDKDLVHIKSIPSLRVLYVNSHYITDSGVEHLRELRSLKSLAVYSTQISRTGIADLKMGLPNCRIEFTTARPTPTPTSRDDPVS